MDFELIECNVPQKVTFFQCVTAIINTAIGGIFLTMPVKFGENGILLSLSATVAFAIVSYFTTYIIVRYQREDDVNLMQMLERISNKKTARYFTFLVSLMAFFCDIIYFLLMNKCLYTVITYFIYNDTHDSTSYAPPDGKQLIFNKFSLQYQSIILIFPVFYLFQIRDLTTIMRFASFGVLGLILCSILIIGLLADNLINGELLADKKQINLFTENFSSVSENLQFAFFMQSYIIHLVTKHNDLEKNTRALKFGVLFTFLIYALAGVLGALALVGRQRFNNQGMIFDYFKPNNLFSTVLQFVYLVHLVTAIPFWNHLARTQFFLAIGDEEPSKQKELQFNIFTTLICLVIQFFTIKVAKVLDFIATLISWQFVYIVPFFVRKREIYLAQMKQLSVTLGDVRGTRLPAFDTSNTIDLPVNYKESIVDQQENEQLLSGKSQKPKNISVYEYFLWAVLLAIGIMNKYLQIHEIFS